MKKILTAASVILAAGMLAGCGKSESGASLGTSSARQSSVSPQSTESSAVRSEAQSSAVSSSFESVPYSSSSESIQESSAGSPGTSGAFPEFPVKNEQKYQKLSITYENNRITGMETEIFDDHDNCVYWSSMGSEMFQAYEYNEDGSVSKRYIDTPGTYEICGYENGLMTRTERYVNGKLDFVFVKEYDKHGNVTLFKELTPENLVNYGSVYEYEYDQNGNWTTRRIYDIETRELYETETRALDDSERVIGGTYESRTLKRSYEIKYDGGGNPTDEYRTQMTVSGEISAKTHIVTKYDAQNREFQISEYSVEDGGEVLVKCVQYNYTEL